MPRLQAVDLQSHIFKRGEVDTCILRQGRDTLSQFVSHFRSLSQLCVTGEKVGTLTLCIILSSQLTVDRVKHLSTCVKILCIRQPIELFKELKFRFLHLLN